MCVSETEFLLPQTGDTASFDLSSDAIIALTLKADIALLRRSFSGKLACTRKTKEVLIDHSHTPIHNWAEVSPSLAVPVSSISCADTL